MHKMSLIHRHHVFFVLAVAVLVMLANRSQAQQLASHTENDLWRATIAWPALCAHSEPQPPALSQPPPVAPHAEGETEGGVMTEESTSSTTTVEPEPLLRKGFLYGDPRFRDKPRPVGSPF